MSSVVIDEIRVADRGKKLEPLQIQFSHCQSPLKPEGFKNIKSGIYSESEFKNEYVAICQVDNQRYMGSTKGQNQKESQILYIALKNKVTNKVKLVEISKVSLSPVVQYPPTSNPVLIDDGSSNMEKEFVHRFGMLKGQRMYDQAERLTVKAENVKANLENAAIGTAIQDSELVVPKSSDSYEIMLPPRNTDAKLPSQVYQIENIVSENDMTALEGITLKLMADEHDPDTQEKFKEFSVYFTKEFNCLMKSSHLNKEDKLQCLKALLYTECLIKFSAIKRRSITWDLIDKSLPTSIPGSVKKSIKEKFAEGWYVIITIVVCFAIYGVVLRTLSKMSRDKIICHAIALALAVGSCSVDAESFSSSLKLDMQSLENLIRVVGARTDKDKSNGVSKIVLKIPLAIPPQKRGQMKRKERR